MMISNLFLTIVELFFDAKQLCSTAGGAGFGALDGLRGVAVGEWRPRWGLLAGNEGVEGGNGSKAVIPEWVAETNLAAKE